MAVEGQLKLVGWTGFGTRGLTRDATENSAAKRDVCNDAFFENVPPAYAAPPVNLMKQSPFRRPLRPRR